MGLESTCLIEIALPSKKPVRVSGKALLESTGIILRGDAAIRRTIPLTAISDARVDGDWLRFTAAGAGQIEPAAIALELGATVAAKWLAKFAAPPRTLAQKLGLNADALTYLLGRTDDVALLDAIRSSQAKSISAATLIIAIVTNTPSLQKATTQYLSSKAKFIWIVMGKGKLAALPESEVREYLHAQGLRDSKSCSVSDALTATRYGR
jgi:hypothetical protein